jgi:hypothetical protein
MVQESGKKPQAREDMVEQEVQEVEHLSEVMKWGGPGPLAEAVGQGELRKYGGALVGQEVLQFLLMDSPGFLKLYNTIKSIPPLIILRQVEVSINIFYLNHASNSVHVQLTEISF